MPPCREDLIEQTPRRLLQYTGIYGVIRHLDQECPNAALPVGAHAYFLTVPWKSVFAGEKGALRDVHGEAEECESDDGGPHWHRLDAR
jgi:hypothetical protein